MQGAQTSGAAGTGMSGASATSGAAAASSAAAPSLSLHTSSSGVRVAVVGCGHGELDKMYACVLALQQRHSIRIDLLLCCGDFQSVRDYADLECMACPPKYRALNTFYKYYTGEAVAPCLTIFIGGNHEASNYLVELFHGGWVAPNIYYLGFGGVVSFGGLRIGGLSGIFNERHVRQGHHERAPFDNDTQRSVYHVREFDVWRLMQLRQDGNTAADPAAAAAAAAAAAGVSPAASAAPFDIFLSHDWPRNIAHHGNTNELIRRKKFLASEIADGSLGSPPAETLLHALRPRYWFSAHLHVKFAAVVRHDQQKQQQQQGAATPAESASATSSTPSVTQFLALDKCLPHREYMQLLEFPAAQGPKVLCYDAHWLAVLKATHPLLSLQRQAKPIPQPPRPGQQAHARWDYRPTEAELEWVRGRVAASNAAAIAADPSVPPMAVPLNFVRTVPGWSEGQPTRAPPGGQLPFQINPQTSALLHMLDLPDVLTQAYARGGGGGGGGYGSYGQQGQGMYGGGAPPMPMPLGAHPPPQHSYSPAAVPASKKQRTDDPAAAAAAASHNPDEIDLDALGDGEDGCCKHNPDEIDLEEPDDEGRLPTQAAAAPAAATASAPQVSASANDDEINIDDM